MSFGCENYIALLAPLAPLLPVALGYALDLALGDPHGFPHIIRAAGWLIDRGERLVRPLFPATPRGEFRGGAALVAGVCAACVALPWSACAALRRVCPWLGLAAETFVCYQLIAVRALRDESLKVYTELEKNDLPSARRAVSMIVGRDTERLDAEGVTKAAVETVAESSGDGIVSPLLWLGLLGLPGGCLCKAVNTMDSMIGYKNARYRHFGTVAARLDDALNFVPARVAGLLTVAAAALTRMDWRGCLRVLRRDRLKHASPNSAHTEAAFAGALGVRLAGPASYGGELERKPFLGDATRPVAPEDILKSHRLMFAISHLALCAALALRLFVYRW